eukprot:gene17889-9541_t
MRVFTVPLLAAGCAGFVSLPVKRHVFTREDRQRIRAANAAALRAGATSS